MANKILTFEPAILNCPTGIGKTTLLTNFIPPNWASEMNKDKPAVTFMDEYKIENGKEWHKGE